MSGLARTLATATEAERRDARRGLLATPLVGQREDPDLWVSILRHRRPLVDWFAEHTGWHLVVDESGGFARLHKTCARPDATRPAVSARGRRPFDRRRYTLTCLALAALDERRGQTTLRYVADAVGHRSRELSGVPPYDATRHTDRRALVDALRLLVSLGVLRERDGDAERYASGGASDALYDVDDRRIAQLISAPSSPSLVDDPADLPLEVYPDTDDGQRLRARHRVMRRLLDDPVLYYEDLDAREREWIQHAHAFVRDRLEADLGLAVERRAEGLAAVDPEGTLSDESFPDGSSSAKHAALLLCEQLTARAREVRARETSGGEGAQAANGGAAEACFVTDREAALLAGRLAQEVGTRCGWRAAYGQGEAGAEALAEDAFSLLSRFGLVGRVAGGWVPRPAIARFAPASPGASGRPARSTARAPSLFDGVDESQPGPMEAQP